ALVPVRANVPTSGFQTVTGTWDLRGMFMNTDGTNKGTATWTLTLDQEGAVVTGAITPLPENGGCPPNPDIAYVVGTLRHQGLHVSANGQQGNVLAESFTLNGTVNRDFTHIAGYCWRIRPRVDFSITGHHQMLLIPRIASELTGVLLSSPTVSEEVSKARGGCRDARPREDRPVLASSWRGQCGSNRTPAAHGSAPSTGTGRAFG